MSFLGGAALPALSPDDLAKDENFWSRVRAEYATPEADFINLEFGWYHPCTNAVMARQLEIVRDGHRRGSHYKRGEMTADREMARAELARFAGADPEEIIITRNATESMNIVIQGMPLDAGDGIVHGDQDYPSVVQALEQRAARSNLDLQVARIPLDPQSDEEIVECFAAAITPRTRALLITHLINHTGQVLPLRKLCALGRAHGLQVIVDAAHSFAQLNFTLRDVDCDCFVASLHKWLGAPLGTGMLYVRRDRIDALKPFFADTAKTNSDIRKLEHFGNGPDSNYLGLIEAIRVHEVLGTAAKEARLRFLQRRWTRVARSLPGVRMLTPESHERHGVIGVFAIDGVKPSSIVKKLWDDHRILVNALEHPTIRGVRATPGLPTSTDEVDRLIHAIQSLSRGQAATREKPT